MNYFDFGVATKQWVIVKMPTGVLRDLGFLTLQGQLDYSAESDGEEISAPSRVCVKEDEKLLYAFAWADQERLRNGEPTGRVRVGEVTLYIGEAAYEVAKRARKLADF